LAQALAQRGFRVVAADASWKSLLVARRLRGQGLLLVVADLRRLPFAPGTFPSASSAETLEHLEEDEKALAELFRVLKDGGLLVGTVPHDPRQWSAWDQWAGHVRRYKKGELEEKLARAGFVPCVKGWGFPLVRLYDALFLKRVNRRRLELPGPARSDPFLRALSRLGRFRPAVAVARWAFHLDRLFLGCPWGVGLLFSAHKPPRGSL
jgi:SAM-dependent methyltransferase